MKRLSNSLRLSYSYKLRANLFEKRLRQNSKHTSAWACTDCPFYSSAVSTLSVSSDWDSCANTVSYGEQHAGTWQTDLPSCTCRSSALGTTTAIRYTGLLWRYWDKSERAQVPSSPGHAWQLHTGRSCSSHEYQRIAACAVQEGPWHIVWDQVHVNVVSFLQRQLWYYSNYIILLIWMLEDAYHEQCRYASLSLLGYFHVSP